jgi:hypothetical protein
MLLFRLSPATVAFLLSLTTLDSLRADPLDNWTVRWTNSTESLNEIAYGKGIFVAVGWHGLILSSPDAKVWTPRSSGVTDDLHHVTFARDKFYAFTWGNFLTSSPDGVSWTAMNTYAAGLGSLRTMLWTNDLLITGGQLDTYGFTILTSPDAISWTRRFSTPSPYILDAAFGGGMYVAVGAANIIVSPDGINWTNIVLPYFYGSVYRIAYGNHTFAAVGDISGPGVIITSTNGWDWTERHPGYSWISEAAFGNGTFLLLGNAGQIETSQDAITWTPRNSGTTTAALFGRRCLRSGYFRGSWRSRRLA